MGLHLRFPFRWSPVALRLVRLRHLAIYQRDPFDVFFAGTDVGLTRVWDSNPPAHSIHYTSLLQQRAYSPPLLLHDTAAICTGFSIMVYLESQRAFAYWTIILNHAAIKVLLAVITSARGFIIDSDPPRSAPAGPT